MSQEHHHSHHGHHGHSQNVLRGGVSFGRPEAGPPQDGEAGPQAPKPGLAFRIHSTHLAVGLTGPGTGGLIRARVEKLRSLFYGALFYMTDRSGKEVDIILSVILPVSLVLVDGFQLAALGVTSGWYQPSISWLSLGPNVMRHIERSSAVFQVLYWGTVALLAMTISLTVYAARMYQIHSFKILPIRILRFLVPLLVSALYIPALSLLSAPFFCTVVRGREEEAMWVDALCGEGQWQASLAASTAVLISYIPFAAIMASVYHDSDPLSANVGARAHGRVQLAYVTVQSALVLLNRPLRSTFPVVFNVILLVASAAMVTLMVVLMPYYQHGMNLLRAGLFGLAGTIALGSIVVSTVADDARLGVSVTFIVLIVPVALLCAGAVHLRMRSLTRKIRLRAMGGFADGAVPNAAESPVTGFYGTIPQRKRARLHGLNLLDRSQGFLIEAQVELSARAALNDSENADPLTAAEAVYEDGMLRFPRSPYLALHYATFLSSYKKARESALLRMRMAERYPKVALDIRFLLSAKRREWTQMDYSSSLGEAAGISAVAILEFQLALDEATRRQNEALRSIRLFWRGLARIAPAWDPTAKGHAANRFRRLSIGSVLHASALHGYEQRLASIERSKANAERAYRRLLSKFPRSPALCRAFAYFRKEICQDPAEGAAFYARADDLEEHESLAAALAAGAAGSASSGKGAGNNTDREDTLSESSVSYNSRARHNRERGRSATEFLAASAFDGSRAVRSLRRAIAASCFVLLILLLVLCSVSIRQLEQQATSLDRVAVVSSLRTMVLEAVDAVRSLSLSAAAGGGYPPPGYAAAAALAKRSASSLLAAARSLYFADERASSSWGTLSVSAPLYLADAGAGSPTVALTRMSVWDATNRFGERALTYAALPATDAAVSGFKANPTFRFVCDAGIGAVVEGLARLTDAYEDASRSYLRIANVVFAALAGSVVLVGLVVGFGVFQPGLRRVARNKLNMADVVTRIPATVVKDVSKHYGTVRLIASDSEDENNRSEAGAGGDGNSSSESGSKSGSDAPADDDDRETPVEPIAPTQTGSSGSLDGAGGVGLGLLHSAGPGQLKNKADDSPPMNGKWGSGASTPQEGANGHAPWASPPGSIHTIHGMLQQDKPVTYLPMVAEGGLLASMGGGPAAPAALASASGDEETPEPSPRALPPRAGSGKVVPEEPRFSIPGSIDTARPSVPPGAAAAAAAAAAARIHEVRKALGEIDQGASNSKTVLIQDVTGGTATPPPGAPGGPRLSVSYADDEVAGVMSTPRGGTAAPSPIPRPQAAPVTGPRRSMGPRTGSDSPQLEAGDSNGASRKGLPVSIRRLMMAGQDSVPPSPAVKGRPGKRSARSHASDRKSARRYLEEREREVQAQQAASQEAMRDGQGILAPPGLLNPAGPGMGTRRQSILKNPLPPGVQASIARRQSMTGGSGKLENGPLFRSLRLRVWISLGLVGLVAAGTFCACYFMAARSHDAAGEFAAIGRVRFRLAETRTFARDLYVGDWALGLEAAGLAARVDRALADARAGFDSLKYGLEGLDGLLHRTRDADGLLYGPEAAATVPATADLQPGPSPSSAPASGEGGLNALTQTYLESALAVMKANGALDPSGALLPAAALPARGAPSYALWNDSASFGDPSLRLVRTASVPLLDAFGQLASMISADTTASIASLKSVLIAVLCIDVAFMATLYMAVFQPMLKRLEQETSRAAQLLSMIPPQSLTIVRACLAEFFPNEDNVGQR